MAEFEAALEKLLQVEGGWCDVPGDKGGETFCGISRKNWPFWDGWRFIARAKTHHSFGEGPQIFNAYLSTLPGLQRQVEEFYRSKFWKKVCCETMPQDLAEEVFEQAVNMGVFRAVLHLQKALNAMNCFEGQPLFEDLEEDGVLGVHTKSAVEVLLRKRSQNDLLAVLNHLQACRYIDLAAAQSSQRKFLRGWMTRTKQEVA